MITWLIWAIWTSLSAVPRKAVEFNHSLTHSLTHSFCEWTFSLLVSGCLRGPGLNPGLTRGRQLVSSPFEITSLCQYTIKIKQQICRLRARCEMIYKDVMKFPNHPHKNCTQMQHSNEIGRSSNWMLYKHRSHCRLLKTERKRLSWWLLYCHLRRQTTMLVSCSQCFWKGCICFISVYFHFFLFNASLTTI